MTRGLGRAAIGYGVITAMCLAVTAWAVVAGLTRVEVLGHPVRVRFTECHSEGGGRAGSHTVCSGPQVDAPTHTVKVSYQGHPDETVQVAREPWGGYEGVDTGFLSWAIAIMLPVVPLLAAAVVGGVTVVKVRRWRGLGDWI
ncbi:hypothetical protein ACFUIY_33430 [Streptomyces griseorubiginosus]|uniref:hypothetical protein n=1 Tax=Streptomyces griseorubiginosus TaxID=67304 RepID=UPI00363035A7